MIILDYQKKYHNKIIEAAVAALKSGKSVVYPTDTSYGLAVDATNIKAIKKLYRIKGRNFNQPVHIVVPSFAYAKSIAVWNSKAEKLAKMFWPGPLTLVLGLRSKGIGYRLLSGGTSTLGLRYPKNKFALDLVKSFNRPITATSANPAKILGGFDSYSAKDVIRQFENKKYQPDVIINSRRLPKRKPSTLVKVFDDVYKIMRPGPVSEKQIHKALGK